MSTTEMLAPASDPRYELPDPADRTATFLRDRMHFPFPVSPLFQSIHATGFSQGYTTAAREYDLPMVDYQIRYLNCYQYERAVFAEPSSPEEAERLGEQSESAMKAQFPIMRKRWYEEHLPQIDALYRRIDQIASADPATIGPDAVAELRHIHRALWTIHFRIVMPQLIAQQVFDEFYTEVMGAGHDPHALQLGITSKTIEAGIAMSDLAGRARNLGLGPVVLETAPDEVMSRLEETDTGRTFLNEVRTYLESYGYHQDFFDFVVPTWVEEPAPLFSALRPYIESGRDNRAEHERRAQAAEAAVAEAREVLRAYPEPVRQQFEALLSFALDANFLHEEHNFYIDQQGWSRIRIALLTIGRALVQRDVIDHANDIFMLQLDEVSAALAGERPDLREVVTERRATFERAWNETPPPFVGAPPAGPPPDSVGTRAMGRFFGVPPAPSTDPSVVMGTGGSSGIVTAPAYVARTLEAATGVPPGHILVTVTTTPQWTPLFGVVAGVVTETGGPLSHSAIVAREYGIPAVVGAFGATERISTGDRITVDGSKGTIHLPE